MQWMFVIAALSVALLATEKIARSLPNRYGYRRIKARLLNRFVRNDLAQSFVVPQLRANFGPQLIKENDISDHLSELFFDVVNAQPKLIVELGTRGGESTRVLLSAADVLDARVLSIDIVECSRIDLPAGQAARWTFVQADDVAFGIEKFTGWCKQQDLPPVADVIFLDTSHLYDHTVAELDAWLPHLKVGAPLILHDTNMRPWMYRRLNNGLGVGAYNDRGVIRALEKLLGRQYDENTTFSDLTERFLIKHHSHSNGYTVLKKLS